MAFIGLFGFSGSGKTHSLGTILTNTKKNLIVISTEHKCRQTLANFARINKINKSDWKGRLHFVTIASVEATFTKDVRMMETYSRLDADEILKQKDSSKKDFAKYLHSLLTNLDVLISDSGEKLGSISELGPDWVVAIDNQSMLTYYAELQVKGRRPGQSLPERGQVQHWIERVIIGLKEKASQPNSCHVVMLAHASEVEDESDKLQKIQVKLNGKALNSTYLTHFTDFIYAYRNKTEFYWATDKQRVVTRTANLPLKDKLPPDFGPLLTAADESEGDFFDGF